MGVDNIVVGLVVTTFIIFGVCLFAVSIYASGGASKR